MIYPSLNLTCIDDFLSGLCTFSRNTIGNRQNSSRILESIVANIVRPEYSNIGDVLGWLFEEQRTNLILHSEDLAGNFTNSEITITANNTLSPANTLTADKIVNTNLNSTHSMSGSSTVENGSTYTFSVFAKAGEISKIELSIGNSSLNSVGFNLYGDGSTFANTLGNTQLDSTKVGIKALPNGYYRVFVVHTSTSTTLNYSIHLNNGTTQGELSSSNTTYPGVTGYGAFIWGLQLEKGTFPTSYLPTTTSTTTRNTDLMSVFTNSIKFNQVESTLLLNFYLQNNTTSAQYIIDLNDQTGNNSVKIYRGPDNNFYCKVTSGGAVLFTINLGSLSLYTHHKLAFAWKDHDFSIMINGSKIDTHTYTLSTMTSGLSVFNIGSDSSSVNSFNNIIKSVKYYPQRLDDVSLRMITK